MVASRRRSKVGPVAAKTVDRGVVRRFRRTFFHDGGTHDLRKGGGKAFEEAMPSGGGGGAKGTSGRKSGGVAAQEGKGGPKGMVPWNEWNDPLTNSWDSGVASSDNWDTQSWMSWNQWDWQVRACSFLCKWNGTSPRWSWSW